MASLKNHEASSSSSTTTTTITTCAYKNDVFLSFRGEDTRNNFVSHLYKALSHKGIDTFKDDKDLDRGKFISSELMIRIQESRFSIIVFSPNYASSTWCLEELHKIIQCVDANTQIALPIFHGVDPSHLLNLTGTFGEALAKHEKDPTIDMVKVQLWRSDLIKAANLAGWDSRDKEEASCIEAIVRDMSNRLSCKSSNTSLRLVGMDPRKKKIEFLLAVGLNDVRMVGICGMGGIGKTTIAEFVYGHLSSKFDGCCFLGGVRESLQRCGLDDLRQKLLSKVLREEIKSWEVDLGTIKRRLHSKCVLIVLDDVDNKDQLEALAGNHDWFGHGSRIIMTSRNKQLLNEHRVDGVYDVEHLNNFESLQLFHQFAFEGDHVTGDFMKLSQRVVEYVKGLPLAVKVLGSSLYRKGLPEWEGELNKLEGRTLEKVQNVLRISFDGLDDVQKTIFLDIACFFKGDYVDNFAKFLEACGFSPAAELRTLCDKSLITILENKISMHDLLQEMGREIVRRESEDLGRRSRLWDHMDVHHVLAENMGTEKVEGMILDLSKITKANFNSEVFFRMSKLRLLKICYSHLPAGFAYPFEKELYQSINTSKMMDAHATPKNTKVHLTGRLKFLSNELRCLHWYGYPLKQLPSNFYPRNLVELDMSCSRIKKFWTKTELFDKLKLINLSNSEELVGTPDFKSIPNLEILILEGCEKLTEVHSSIGFTKASHY